ncbi:MAG: TauD/TfdA family dioxygenase [Rhodoferax sp.]|nr:TauD/TfdA family dioxygenase [Rhodoferax sp.]
MNIYKHLSVQKASPAIGAYLTGVDLNNINDPAIYEEIRKAVHEFGVVFLHKQPLEDKNFVALGREFGSLESSHPVFGVTDAFKEIQPIVYDPREPITTQEWHTDNTYNEFPSRYTFLRSVDIPPLGGDTLWASNAAIYDELGEPLQKALEQLWARHDLFYRMRETAYLERAGKPEGAAANFLKFRTDHPVVIQHPVTGRKQIFVNRHFTTCIHHMTDQVSFRLLHLLFDMVKLPEFQCRLIWEKDMVVIWDNWATQHYATLDYGKYPRTMTRMVGESALRPSPVDGAKMYDSGVEWQSRGLLRKA